MKNEYTKEHIVEFIKTLDTRAKTFSPEKIDQVINRAYAELTAVSRKIFSNEDITDLGQYYDSGQSGFTAEVLDDVTEIYKIYTTVEGPFADKTICQYVNQDVGEYYDDNVAYRDNRNVGTIHVRLDAVDTKFDNLVVKYYYTPSAQSQSVYMDSQTYLSWQDAIGTAVNYFLHDSEEESRKRASLARTSKSMTQEPEDAPEEIRAVFSGF